MKNLNVSFKADKSDTEARNKFRTAMGSFINRLSMCASVQWTDGGCVISVETDSVDVATRLAKRANKIAARCQAFADKLQSLSLH